MANDVKTFWPGAAAAPLLPERAGPVVLQPPLLQKDIQPPAALWVDANDILELRTRNSQSGVSLQVSARLMEPDGRIITPQFTQAPTADRTINSATQALYQGYLLGATVIPIGGTLPRRGQTFCLLRVTRMPAPSALTHFVLGADYVTASQPLEWPYGRIANPLDGRGAMLSNTVTTPAAGADWSFATSGQARTLIRGGTAQLVTAAAVATRQVALIVDDGATTLYTIEAASTQLAGITQVYSFIPGDTLTTLIATQQPVFLPPELVLGPGWRIRVSTTALQAADQWSAIQLFLEQWLED